MYDFGDGSFIWYQTSARAELMENDHEKDEKVGSCINYDLTRTIKPEKITACNQLI